VLKLQRSFPFLPLCRFIDIDLVLGVREVSPDQQDKNCSTFIVRCEGRSFQLQAVDQITMKKWMRAIEFLASYRKLYREKREADAENLANGSQQQYNSDL
jgi:hypothetical protein